MNSVTKLVLPGLNFNGKKFQGGTSNMVLCVVYL